MKLSIDEILGLVKIQVEKAMAKHAPMNSPHEGHSVIREEVDELWDHVKTDTAQSTEAMEEALQIAAMGIRYVHDLCQPAIQSTEDEGTYKGQCDECLNFKDCLKAGCCLNC